MKKNNIINLKIGDFLYKYIRGIFKYKVVSIRTDEFSTQYVVECMECKDHDNCKVLITQIDNYDAFIYVAMIDEDEENEQYYFHNDRDYYFFQSEIQVKKQCAKILISKKETELKNLKERIKKLESDIEQLKVIL